ncbi:MAG: DNA-directed RNA polymerase specialized sigma24 family protein [Pirellulaceae bacterium]|jgi:DNA-directed RNA polymerase specialized sigma24 family protein
MSTENSITHWVQQLKDGNDAAAHPLWDRFFSRMTVIAKQGLKGQSLPMADEEDIALSAFHSLCSGLRDGRFPELQSRESLWRLLLVITTRKVADQFAFDRRSKRDSNRIARADDGKDEDDLVRQLVSREPTPEMVAQVSEQIARLMESLVHEDLQTLALLKMEGFKNAEIAQEMNRSVATVERKLRTIRSIWDQVK